MGLDSLAITTAPWKAEGAHTIQFYSNVTQCTSLRSPSLEWVPDSIEGWAEEMGTTLTNAGPEITEGFNIYNGKVIELIIPLFSPIAYQ